MKFFSNLFTLRDIFSRFFLNPSPPTTHNSQFNAPFLFLFISFHKVNSSGILFFFTNRDGHKNTFVFNEHSRLRRNFWYFELDGLKRFKSTPFGILFRHRCRLRCPPNLKNVPSNSTRAPRKPRSSVHQSYLRTSWLVAISGLW